MLERGGPASIATSSIPSVAARSAPDSAGFVIFVWWVTCFIWSSVYLFIKIGVRDVPPATFGAARLLIALAILTPLLAIRRAPMPRRARDWMLIAASGLLLLGFNYGLLFWGARYISSGLSALLQAVTPAFGLLFAHAMLDDERFTKWQGIGLTLGVVGVGVIFADQLKVTGNAAFFGSLAATGSAACVALGYVIVKKFGSHLQPSDLTSGQMLFGLVPLCLLIAIREGNPLAVRWTSQAIIAVVYLAIAGSVVAFWLNYWLLKRVGATKLLAMSLVEPFIAVVLGAIFLREALPAGTLLGGLCILASTWMVLAPPQQSVRR
jgi:drug/metabolite transporter (DMT)-like permease